MSDREDVVAESRKGQLSYAQIARSSPTVCACERQIDVDGRFC